MCHPLGPHDSSDHRNIYLWHDEWDVAKSSSAHSVAKGNECYNTKT